ncbi:MAG TPA: RIP metalloprotease RseP [Puia sp.]|jgi:regulator of sigma E protease|nr:RIP metalloprotease RseP [Puia sp.]
MVLLAIDWGSVGIKVIQFILSFSILVILHELGHFLPARWFKCRVEKFYLFFNPWFSLFKRKIGETEYGLGWIPFGGYVKISGMIDESMDKEQMQKPPQPWEFRSKPAWQRLIIMLGGVTVNVLLAFTIFIMIMWVWGDRYIPISHLKYGLYADSLGRKMGMQDGDNIIAVAGKPVERVGTVGSEMIMNEAKTITVLRNGKEVELNVPPGVIGQLNKNRLLGMTIIRYPLIVDSLLPTAHVLQGNIQHNDTLINLDGHPVYYMSDLLKDTTFDHLKEMKSVPVAFRRGNDTVHAVIAIDSKIGLPIHLKTMEDLLGSVHTSYTFWQAIPAGIHKSVETLTNYIRNLKLLFTSKEVKAQDSLGSVISIASVFPSVWDWQSFWTLTGIFSILLAFMNVLPIPALDGGHALFTLVEMISGRKPSDKFIEYAQMVGMVLLFGIMIYAMGLDIFHAFKFK